MDAARGQGGAARTPPVWWLRALPDPRIRLDDPPRTGGAAGMGAPDAGHELEGAARRRGLGVRDEVGRGARLGLPQRWPAHAARLALGPGRDRGLSGAAWARPRGRCASTGTRRR